MREFGACSRLLSCSHVPSARLAMRRRKKSRPQPLLPTLRPQRGTLHFWSATPLVRKAIRACLRPGGTSWTITPRPEATLFADFFGQPVQIITHFASFNTNPKEGITPPLGGNATWQSSFDTSKVWAVAVGHIDAGTDRASCPNSGSIQCLLLKSVGNQAGPTGGKLLATTTFVQRLNTKGGSAPTSACTVGQTQLVPYTADYFFFHQDK